MGAGGEEPRSPPGTATPSQGSSLFLSFPAHILSPFLWVTEAVENVTITVNAVPPFPLEGQDVTLVPDGIKIGSVSCLWYRGEGVNSFPLLFIQLQPKPEVRPQLASDGRQTAGPDCSMRIQNLAFTDTGIYGVLKNRTTFLESGEVLVMVTASKCVTCASFLEAEGKKPHFPALHCTPNSVACLWDGPGTKGAPLIYKLPAEERVPVSVRDSVTLLAGPLVSGQAPYPVRYRKGSPQAALPCPMGNPRQCRAGKMESRGLNSEKPPNFHPRSVPIRFLTHS
uniref:Uncharacterized protein n=1 Tax=Varanus komodoensis TaxID=61221 RepID=A0A8D2J4Q0_VARKO